MEDDSGEGIPMKRRKVCCIHVDGGNHKGDSLTCLKDKSSWESLLRAAQIRQYEPILEAAKSLERDQIPDLCYHRTCRQNFTLKKSLDKIISENYKDDKADEARHSSRKVKAHSSRPTYEEECIFCQRKSKYLKGTNTREQLAKCSTLNSDQSVREAAISKHDDRIMALVSRDIVAAEACYHRSCYRTYTRPDRIQKEKEDNDGCSCLETKAYDMLFMYIRDEFFTRPDVIYLSSLSEKLKSFMTSVGCGEMYLSTKKNLRRKLETEFGTTLCFTCDDKGDWIVYPDSLSRNEMAKSNIKLQRELHMMKSKSFISCLERTANAIRKDINDQDCPTSWPPQPTDLSKSSIELPFSLTTFLRMVFGGSLQSECVSVRVENVVNSVGQDIVYCVSSGRKILPKHILLPFVIKSLTGNVELITILNRLGHCTSCSMSEQIETALCMQKVEEYGNECPALPSNVHPLLPTTLVWDNIDRLEETLSGKGTSHRINGIIVQPPFIGPLPQRDTHSMQKTKKRSFSLETKPLPVYNAGSKSGPPHIDITLDMNSVNANQSRLKNLSWVLKRFFHSKVPSWTGFNIKLYLGKDVQKDTLGYLPTINAPATCMSAVHEVLQQSKQIQCALQLPAIVCVFDQALYAKAAEIVWKHQSDFCSIVLRLGDFHTICNLLATIGKRFQDAGLHDLCVESGIIAEGSVQGVMEGKHYNRAIRLHKLVYEAILRLAWKQFVDWISEHYSEDVVHLDSIVHEIREMEQSSPEGDIVALLNTKSGSQTVKRFTDYLSFLRDGKNGNLAAFWVSYLDMVDILLGLVRAAREGDWTLHLNSIRAMIPWVFAYDKLNYARYLPVYYAQMMQLSNTHPTVHEHLQNGGFSVQLGSQNPFGKIPADQAIEETVNKDTQTSGGTKGFSLNKSAVARYYITAEHRCAAVRQMRALTRLDDASLHHPDLQESRIKRDETDVSAIVNMLENNWLNPIGSNETELLSLSTGKVANEEVTRDIMNAHSIGEQAYQEFKEKRLHSEPPIYKFHDKMKKQKLKTFSELTKKQTFKLSDKDIVLKADRNLFGQMVLVAQSRNIDLEDVLAHPLGPIPWALATPEGTIRKTNKASLVKALTQNVSVAEDIPSPSACIIDAMSIVQKTNGDNKTFSQIAESIFTLILQEGSGSARIDIIFDTYRANSIKQSERERRGVQDGNQFRELHPGHRVQQWRRFLANNSNKSSLIHFLNQEWKTEKYRHRLNGKVLFITCEQHCSLVAENGWKSVDVLKCNHEEADTRLFLHANHASHSGGYNAIVIVSEDTDVLVLSLLSSLSISVPLFIRSGTKNRTVILDISKIAHVLGNDVCKALPGIHAFTGCDSVSAFAGKGKLGALKLLKKDVSAQTIFNSLGQDWIVSDKLCKDIEAFTCTLYDSSSNISSVNKCRYNLFRSKRGVVESSQLPPCHDSLLQHIARANYQTAVWRRTLDANPDIPSPVGMGWLEQGGRLEPLWMKGSPAPTTILQFLSCTCSRSCNQNMCQCMKNGLKCTDLCKLANCANWKKEDFTNEAEISLHDEEFDDEEGADNDFQV